MPNVDDGTVVTGWPVVEGLAREADGPAPRPRGTGVSRAPTVEKLGCAEGALACMPNVGLVPLNHVGQWRKDLLVKQMARRLGRVGQALAVPQR